MDYERGFSYPARDNAHELSNVPAGLVLHLTWT